MEMTGHAPSQWPLTPAQPQVLQLLVPVEGSAPVGVTGSIRVSRLRNFDNTHCKVEIESDH